MDYRWYARILVCLLFSKKNNKTYRSGDSYVSIERYGTEVENWRCAHPYINRQPYWTPQITENPHLFVLFYRRREEKKTHKKTSFKYIDQIQSIGTKCINEMTGVNLFWDRSKWWWKKRKTHFLIECMDFPGNSSYKKWKKNQFRIKIAI